MRCLELVDLGRADREIALQVERWNWDSQILQDGEIDVLLSELRRIRLQFRLYEAEPLLNIFDGACRSWQEPDNAIRKASIEGQYSGSTNICSYSNA